MEGNPLRSVLVAFGRVGARAAAAGVASVLKDIDQVTEEAQRRVRDVKRAVDQFLDPKRDRF